MASISRSHQSPHENPHYIPSDDQTITTHITFSIVFWLRSIVATNTLYAHCSIVEWWWRRKRARRVMRTCRRRAHDFPCMASVYVVPEVRGWKTWGWWKWSAPRMTKRWGLLEREGRLEMDAVLINFYAALDSGHVAIGAKIHARFLRKYFSHPATPRNFPNFLSMGFHWLKE